jgi:hypothetical protein
MSYLSRAYPFFYNKRRSNITMAFLASLFVMHTMMIIRPDTVVSKIHTSYFVASVVYSFITFSVIIIWTTFANRLPSKLLEHWRVYNELALAMSCILTMGLLNYAYIFLFGNTVFSLLNFTVTGMLEVVSFTLGSGLIPLLLFTLIHFLRLEIKRKQPESAPIPGQAETSSRVSINEGGEKFELDLCEVFLIESMGNYIKIYENRNDIRNTLIVRLTMKRLEELIQEKKFMMRVHRSYIVNTNHIQHVQRSSFGDLSINFEYRNLVIPVSRSKKKDITNILKSRRIKTHEKPFRQVAGEILQSSI